MKMRALHLAFPLCFSILLSECREYEEQPPEVEEVEEGTEVVDEAGQDEPGAEADNFDDDEGSDADPEEPDLDEEPSEEE